MLTLLTRFHLYITRVLLNVNIGVRLFALMGLAAFVSLLLTLAGMWGLAASRDSLRSVYENRMPALQQLADISTLMLNNQRLLLKALSEINIEASEERRGILVMNKASALIAADAIKKNIASIESVWRSYMSSALSDSERTLANQFEKSRDTYLNEALLPAVVSLRDANYAKTQILSIQTYTLYNQASPHLQALIQHQFDTSQLAYSTGLKRYSNMRLVAYVALGMAIFLMSWLGVILTASIVNPLKQVIAVFNNISGGRYDSRITIAGRDEISEVMAALQSMQSKLGEDELAIHQLAFYDQLTNLPNRRLLRDRLQRAVSISTRSHQFGGVLMIDLDNFKSINDTLGHDVGDLFLQEIALRVQSCLRQSDTVARLGGDEFVVLLVDLSQNEAQAAMQAEEVGEKILTAINQPFMLANQLQHGSASMGLCLFRGQNFSIDELFKRADIAMYQAKNNGRNNLRFYDPQIQDLLEARIALETELHAALTENQLRLYYQIQVDRVRGVLGAEVLLRWMHPKHGLVFPDQFIPIAEESGLIVPIGEWVLRTACAQLKSWSKNPAASNFILSVNVSARQFRQPDFVAEVCKVVAQTGANPQRLKLELTESLVLHNIADTTDKMNKLNGQGIHFSMDDFGTGHSSLAHLTNLPIQELKIDRSFMRNITTKHRDAVIVQAIIDLAKSLGIAVIAEGVESEEQRICLERFGCQSYQGYLFGKPMPLEDFEKLSRSDHAVIRNTAGDLALAI